MLGFLFGSVHVYSSPFEIFKKFFFKCYVFLLSTNNVFVSILDITKIFVKGKEGKKWGEKILGALLSFANEIYSFILEKPTEECWRM